MNLLLPGYDAYALRGPDEPNQIGTQDGELCNRLPEPDGDEPRGYRPKPCTGTMHYFIDGNCGCHPFSPCRDCMAQPLTCDTCREEAE